MKLTEDFGEMVLQEWSMERGTEIASNFEAQLNLGEIHANGCLQSEE